MFDKLVGESGLMDLPIWVMLFFVVVFAAVLGRALSRRRHGHYASMARLPLDEAEARQ